MVVVELLRPDLDHTLTLLNLENPFLVAFVSCFGISLVNYYCLGDVDDPDAYQSVALVFLIVLEELDLGKRRWQSVDLVRGEQAQTGVVKGRLLRIVLREEERVHPGVLGTVKQAQKLARAGVA